MDHVISYLSRRKAVPAGLWRHEVKQSYDPAAVFEEQLKKCGVGKRTPPPASRAPPLSGEALGVAAPPLKGFTRKARTSPAAPSHS